MVPHYGKSTRYAALAVAAAFLIYNIYQAAVTSISVSSFPFIIENLPRFIESSNPQLQLTLVLAQETMGSTGQYLRLAGAIFAFLAAVLFVRGKPFLGKLRWALLLEALYFLLYIPVVVNHLVGSTISNSSYLNIYTGISYFIQITLIFPALFILSRKLKNSDLAPARAWLLIAAPLYLFGFWVRHAFLWVYGVLPMLTEPSLLDVAAAANSVFTLLAAGVMCSVGCALIRRGGGVKVKRGWMLFAASLVVAGAFFVAYDVLSVFLPIYGAYVLLTDAWMALLPVLGIALLYEYTNQKP
jgi:hypothetical protein